MRTVLTAVLYIALCGYLWAYHLDDANCNELIDFIAAPIKVCESIIQ